VRYAFLIFYTGILYRWPQCATDIINSTYFQSRASMLAPQLGALGSKSLFFFFQSNDSDGMLGNEALIYARSWRKVYAISLTHNASPVLNSAGRKGVSPFRPRNDYKL